MKKRVSSVTGFTLVELLVVIGIISVLISMLLPALNKARQSAKTVACLSNLRQLGQAFQMYTELSNGFFPPYYQTTVPGASYSIESWPGMLVATKCVANANIYRCPSLPSIYPNFGTMGLSTVDVAADSAWSYVHYGYNLDDIGSSTRLPGAPKTAVRNLYNNSNTTIPLPAKRNQIHSPSETLLLCDSLALMASPPAGTEVRGYLYAYDQVKYDVGGNGYTCDPRHNGGTAINVLWVDGHATTLALNSKDRGQNPAYPRYTLGVWGSPTSVNANNIWDRY